MDEWTSDIELKQTSERSYNIITHHGIMRRNQDYIQESRRNNRRRNDLRQSMAPETTSGTALTLETHQPRDKNQKDPLQDTST